MHNRHKISLKPFPKTKKELYIFDTYCTVDTVDTDDITDTQDTKGGSMSTEKKIAITLRMTDEERFAYGEAAHEARMKLSEWIRQSLNQAADKVADKYVVADAKIRAATPQAVFIGQGGIQECGETKNLAGTARPVQSVKDMAKALGVTTGDSVSKKPWKAPTPKAKTNTWEEPVINVNEI